MMLQAFQLCETSGLIKGNFGSRHCQKSNLKQVFVAHFGLEAYANMLANPQPLCIPKIENRVLYIDLHLSNYLFSNIPSSNIKLVYL